MNLCLISGGGRAPGAAAPTATMAVTAAATVPCSSVSITALWTMSEIHTWPVVTPEKNHTLPRSVLERASHARLQRERRHRDLFVFPRLAVLRKLLQQVVQTVFLFKCLERRRQRWQRKHHGVAAGFVGQLQHGHGGRLEPRRPTVLGRDAVWVRCVV